MKVFLRVLTVPSRLYMGCLFMERFIQEFPDRTAEGLHYKNDILIDSALHPAPRPEFEVVKDMLPTLFLDKHRTFVNELKEASNKKGFAEMLRDAIASGADTVMLFEEDVYIKKGTLEHAINQLKGLGKEAWCCSLGPYLRPGSTGVLSGRDCPDGVVQYKGTGIKMWGSHAMALSIEGAKVFLQHLEKGVNKVTGWLTDAVLTKAVSENAFKFYITKDVQVYQMHSLQSLKDEAYEVLRALRDAVNTAPTGFGVRFLPYPADVCSETEGNGNARSTVARQSFESPLHGNFCFEKLELMSDSIIKKLAQTAN